MSNIFIILAIALIATEISGTEDDSSMTVLGDGRVFCSERFYCKATFHCCDGTHCCSQNTYCCWSTNRLPKCCDFPPPFPRSTAQLKHQ
uniref:Cysteine rich secreted protein n=1 Tax=Riptortus pedestris TaxID=329032 RepID=R4WIL2_RIPPE|nr:cysteine rich secreted protein [Riptortus pedestris]